MVHLDLGTASPGHSRRSDPKAIFVGGTAGYASKHNSLFWGTCQVLTIPYSVNPRDHAYQRAYKEFTKRLVAARKNAGLTQVQVARRLGRSHTYVSKCELGERRVDFVELQQFARIYGKDINFFITI